MQLTLAVAALVATTTASGFAKREYNFNATCDTSKPHAKVVNRCPYDVYLWSIDKQLGCPQDQGLLLKTGAIYNENFGTSDTGGRSIKLSKFDTCGKKDITQLEYKIDTSENYGGNYLDMSFVDCVGNLEDCPGRTDGFYLKSGNEGGVYASAVNNEHCPIFSVNDATEAAAVSYIKWDDRQTKFCSADANLQLYLCGGEAPGAEAPAPAPSAPAAPSKKPSHKPKPSPPAPSSTEEAVVAAAAAVTPPPAPAAPYIKTEVVYVTEFVKRHAHGRRHQHFHA